MTVPGCIMRIGRLQPHSSTNHPLSLAVSHLPNHQACPASSHLTTPLSSPRRNHQFILVFSHLACPHFNPPLARVERVERVARVERAARAGKAIYCEKPTAVTTEEAVRLARVCEDAGVKNGVVQDKLWLPGLRKLQTLIDQDFFGRILSVRWHAAVCRRIRPLVPQCLPGLP